jgi:hypothetical protein
VIVMRTVFDVAFLLACLWVAWSAGMELFILWYSGSEPAASRAALVTLAILGVAALVAAIAMGTLLFLARE